MSLKKLFAGAWAFVSVFSVFAAPVNQDDARLVARGWGLTNARAFGAFGAVKSVTAEKAADGSVLWYVVVTDKAAVVVSPDDEVEPVIAVIPGGDGTIPEKSPLRVMLKRDLPKRLAGVPAPSRLKMAGASQPAPSAMASKWASLKKAATMKMALGADGNPAMIVRWLDGWNSDATKTVDGKKVQTLRFWDQQDSRYFMDDQVFNRDTPQNAACGCVATAGSAVMHYFRVPSGNPGVGGGCTYGPGMLPLDDVVTAGGDYDWSLIDGLDLSPLHPIELSEAALDLLARVASDCGIGCRMAYNVDGRGSSGSNTRYLGDSFRDVFNVQNVQLVTIDGFDFGQGTDIGTDDKRCYDDIIYNQIRGGAPVVLGIEGHEVVATGYGLDANATPYTYVFLGWGGVNDAWYALPTIDTKATADGGWYTSTIVDELLTEIAPADDKYIPLVGRAMQFGGEQPAAGATVTLSDGQVLTADENGFWGTRIAPPADGTGSVTISYPGVPAATVSFEVGEEAMTTVRSARAVADLAEALPDAINVELEDPSVRVAGHDFSTLNEALIYAAENGDHTAPVVVEVFKDSILQPEDYTITFDCIIRSSPGVVRTVRRISATQLIADAGCTVTLENIHFEKGLNREALTVKAGATAVLSGDVALEKVVVDDGGVLTLTGELNPQNESLVFAEAAQGINEVFATYEGSSPTILAAAAGLQNGYDMNLRAKPVKTETGYDLMWTVLAPPEDKAVAQLTVGEDVLTFDNLDTLLQYATDVSEIKILEAGIALSDEGKLTMTNRVAVSHDFTISARVPVKIKGVPFDSVGRCTGGFDVTDGATLTLSNVVFEDYEVWDRPFIAVQGGSKVVFEAYSGLSRITSGRQAGSTAPDAYDNYNAICVSEGEVTLKQWAAVRDCVVPSVPKDFSNRSLGGAVYLKGEGCTLNLEGGQISGCKTPCYGGGVYAAKGSIVNLSGFAEVKGNFIVGDYGESPSDILIQNETTIVVKGELKGQVIGVYHDLPVNKAGPGCPFAVLDGGASVTKRTAQVFINNRKEYGAVQSESGEQFVWGKEAYVEPEPIDPGEPPAPEPKPVICQPFAFTAIAEQEDGTWKMTLAPATTYCTYTLKTSDDLVNWTVVGEPKTLQPTDDFEFVVDGGELKRFWTAVGEDGVEP